ncbi:MAG: DUF4345 family protein [Flavobacteriaceae bacterium]|nr:DUF4345 family protein [Flavobacteriaceae bacterium]
MEIFKIIVLSLSGLLLSSVGAMRLSNPVKTYLKNSGIQLENEINLLNEMRGVSSVMLSGGIIILLGIVIPKLTFTSFVVAILIFLGFAIGRILSICLAGKPNKLIIQGLISEFVLGAANVFCLIYTLA